MDQVQNFERNRGTYLYERLSKVRGVTIYGPSPKQAAARGRASLASFNVEVRAAWPFAWHFVKRQVFVSCRGLCGFFPWLVLY